MSTLRVNTITDTSGTSANLYLPGVARAWVNFNGTGTVAIRRSLGVSSITDLGTGRYIVNFSSSAPDTNYGVLGTHGGGDDYGNANFLYPWSSQYSVAPTRTVNAISVVSGYVNPGSQVIADTDNLTVAVFW
jgi:hypothetical protein